MPAPSNLLSTFLVSGIQGLQDLKFIFTVYRRSQVLHSVFRARPNRELTWFPTTVGNLNRLEHSQFSLPVASVRGHNLGDTIANPY